MPRPKRKRGFWARLRPKRVRAGVNVGVAHAEAEWEGAKPRRRGRRAKPAPVVPVAPPVPVVLPEDVPPSERLLVAAQEHLLGESKKALRRRDYGEAVVAGAASEVIYRARKRPPKAA